MNTTDLEKDYEVYRQLVDLWSRENPIKTSKLQMVLVVNGLLLTAVSINGGFAAKNWPIYLGGTILCLVWVLSIGRTLLFQKIWQIKISDLAAKYPDDSRFQVQQYKEYMKRVPRLLQVSGGVPSKYYLIGTPFLFGICWLCLFLYFMIFWTGWKVKSQPLAYSSLEGSSRRTLNSRWPRSPSGCTR
jgi:hypothetical protein